MQLSSRARHGARLLINLAQSNQDVPKRAASIANDLGISLKYLEKILKPLRKAGMIKGLRGPGGGYFLHQNPNEITLGGIVQALDDNLRLSCCVEPGNCDPMDYCGAPSLWDDLSTSLQNKLNSITLVGLIQQDESSRNNMSPSHFTLAHRSVQAACETARVA
ncbi:transcriptional regulator, BadM/Rrf2 family [Desulfonatronum thiosulfatophilum]|uniref:Transcriptional regulator, BadM/Rrf2 family n=1 Tax=Desulfonatronum thiosulfatophilum TaxID=617002 RepID=A0A1G6CYA9_9BACT|nr:Rrf2 family transcriptional regulator [Desulfonatronum thiosulfatophilum]SDB37818.1 transcriptional regulator, BadM/Rrf2 family [Desulfonatronum thiosulfatophilum]